MLRDPAARLESLLNYRQDNNLHKRDWTSANLPWKAPISEILAAAPTRSLRGLAPFLTQCHYYKWALRSVVLCNVDELATYLEAKLGFSGCRNLTSMSRKNPSSRSFGRFTNEEKQQVYHAYPDDTRLWNHFCGNGRNMIMNASNCVPAHRHDQDELCELTSEEKMRIYG